MLEIVLSESDVGIGREVAELQATELELSLAMLATHVSLMMYPIMPALCFLVVRAYYAKRICHILCVFNIKAHFIMY